MPERPAAGWDLGGAHLKLAVAEGAGRLTAVEQIPCPLWQGLDRLREALERARAVLPKGLRRHAVTMTGELVDLFSGRAEGVSRLVDAMTAAFPGDEIRIYATAGGLIAPEAARARPEAVGSANWHASAAFASMRVDAALFIDLGSTTADILTLRGGRVETAGMTDAARLATGELVYTGVTRTPVMAVAQNVPFAGTRQGLMAELFATMADVHRLTGRLPEEADLLPSADGGEKTGAASARRLARMLGRDLEDADMGEWRVLAAHLAACQLGQLQDAAATVLSRFPLPAEAPVLAAGVGRFMIADLAARLRRPYLDFASLVSGDAAIADRAACCAPASALALLSLES